jgi:hypothetical protein
MSKISELNELTGPPAEKDMIIVNKKNGGTYITSQMDVVKLTEYILGDGVSVGGDTDGDIVTTNAEQTLTNKTLDMCELDGCTITGASEIVGSLLTSPAISGGHIAGTQIKNSTADVYALPTITEDTELVTLDAEQTLTKKTLTKPLLDAPEMTGGTWTSGTMTGVNLFGALIFNNSEKNYALPSITADTELVTLDAEQTLTRKVIDGSTIHDCDITGTSTIAGCVLNQPSINRGTIDANTTYGGQTLATWLETKPSIDQVATLTAGYSFNVSDPTRSTPRTITDDTLLANQVLNLSTDYYRILWRTVSMTLYEKTGITYTTIPWDGAGINAQLTVAGNYLSTIVLTGLYGDYHLVASFNVEKT